MMKYEVGPFKKPNGPLLDKPQKRLTAKSSFLRAIERKQRVVLPTGAGKSGKVKGLPPEAAARLAEAASRAANAEKPVSLQLHEANKQRRVTQLRLAYNRKRDK